VVVNVNFIGAFTADAGPAVAAIPNASRAEVVSTATMRRRVDECTGCLQVVADVNVRRHVGLLAS